MNNENNISQEDLALIEQYLHLHLPAAELLSFEQRLSADAGWRQKVEEVRLMMVGIQEAVLQDKLDQFHNEINPATLKAVSVQKSSWKKWMAAAAVIVIVILGGSLLFQFPAHEKLFAAYYKPDPGLPVVMGAEGKSHYTLYDGMIDYKEGNYAKAIEKWKSIGDGHTDTLSYYMGLANMSAGNMEQAVKYLDDVLGKEGSVYWQKATWYLALIYIKQDNKEAAATLLKKIEDMPLAKELLSRMSR
ncbi:tetratricopeptide repeat protein [Niabella aquatica]